MGSLLKIIIIIFILILEFWFLLDLKDNQASSIKKINVDKAPVITDSNSSFIDFFDTDIWILTVADNTYLSENIEKEDTDDLNTTISLVSKKNSKQLCKGKKCVTIKGFVSDALILENETKMFSLHLGETIFNTLKFVRYSDTELSFEDNQSGTIYKLLFFSYINKKIDDKNNTRTKDER